jgi:hypothetical protein
MSEPKHRCWSEGCTEEGTVLVYEKSANSPERWVCPTHFKTAQKLQELERGIRGVVRLPTQGSERKVAPMSVSSPNVIEIKQAIFCAVVAQPLTIEADCVTYRAIVPPPLRKETLDQE